MEEKTNEMLSYDAFVYVLQKLSDKLQEFKNRMLYREIYLEKKYGVSTLSRHYRENDPEYAELKYQSERVEHQLNYLNNTACMPADCDIEIPNWMRDDSGIDNMIREEVKEIPVRDEASICANDIVSLLETTLSWSDIEPLVRKRAKAILDCCTIGDGEVVAHCNLEENANFIAMILDADVEGKVWALDFYENHIKPPKED